MWVEFPFAGVTPKPIVLVGENGSGKSILLSHIVNGLIEAKRRAFPITPEVETNMVCKILSPSYIKPGRHWCYAKVIFDEDLFIGELTLSSLRRNLDETPPNFHFSSALDAWNQINRDRNSHFVSNFDNVSDTTFLDAFGKSCVLFFPPNRFEEPAWLNERHLKSKATYSDIERTLGYTTRKVINYSSLQDNQNWLFDVVYDMTAFEYVTENLSILETDSNRVRVIPEWKGFIGDSAKVYDIVLRVVRSVTRRGRNVRFGIGRRLDRTVSLMKGNSRLVPNIFQLSSGETSLLNLFLSILRDFDLTGTTFSTAEEVQGIVVVDEIDLHLHAVHQYEILPGLIQMFPKVQFIVTTHSPLFVLGMNNAFGEDGFALYQLPDGQQISPEEFSEFGNAYKAFRSSSRFSDDVRRAVKNAQRPILYMEGKTDIKYLQRAAKLLGHEDVLEVVDVKDGNGDELEKTWRAISNLPESLVPQEVMILRDCDYSGERVDKGNRMRRTIPKQDSHPIEKGIENLFSKATLEKAHTSKPAFFNLTPAHTTYKRGEQLTVPETWEVNDAEKTNLCNWICENGTVEDFHHFNVIFELLDELVDDEQSA